jgi:death-on-curing family protein
MLAHRLAQLQMSWDEPIPDFGTRYPGRLESCLSSAFQTFGKKDLYPTLLDKAAILFYMMIKNHPFLNGNKRIAVSTLLTFLFINDKWLNASNEEMYSIAVMVATSSPKLRKGTVELIKDFIRTSLVDINDT